MKLLRAVLLAGLVLALTVVAPPAHAESQAGTYKPVAPVRLLDTRTGNGAPNAPLTGGRTLAVQVLGRGGVPGSNVTAVVATLIGVGPTANSFLTAYASGSTRPAVSSITLKAGQTRANTVTLPVGTGGKVSIFNSSGSTEVLLDVVGYYVTGGETANGADLFFVGPQRFLDTRPGAPLAARATGFLVADFDIDNPNVRAISVNISVVGAAAGGYLTAWDGVSARPGTSNANFPGGQTVTNHAVVKTSRCGADCPGNEDFVQFAFYNGSSGAVDIVIDVVGVYIASSADDGLRYTRFLTGQTQRRIVDTRSGLGGSRLGAGATGEFDPGGTVAGNTFAFPGNLTAVSPTASTYLAVWGEGARPGTSNISAPAGRSVSNGVLVPLGESTLTFLAYNRAGSTHVIVDVAGRFDDPTLSPVSGQRARERNLKALRDRVQVGKVAYRTTGSR